MKAIVIEEATFDRVFDDLAKALDLAALEEKARVLPVSEDASAINTAHRKFIHAIRTAQDRLRRER